MLVYHWKLSSKDSRSDASEMRDNPCSEVLKEKEDRM